MRKESKEFLEELLLAPSPSGDEVKIQKIWMDYVKGFAHKVETDMVGNVIASVNPDKPFKVMLAGHCDEIAFMVNYIDDDGYIYIAKAGGISQKLALGMRVRILGKNGVIKGVIGVKAEHQGGAKDEIKIEDIYVDCGAKNKEEIEKYVGIGDYVIYDMDFEYILNNKLVGRGLDNRTGAFIVAEVLRRVSNKNPNVALYAVSTVNEETNMGGAYFAGSSIEPTMAIACDVSFATDYPDVDNRKYGKIKLGEGPILSKGSPINMKINRLMEAAAKENSIPVQYELTPRTTGTDADKIRLSGKGVPVALVSLPLRYMHSPSEIVSLKDIENEIELLTQTILRLKGDESLKPLE
ncbi:M20/M25/M40 family metallo-hydrolase [Paramaledivibacter caminithermalis]|jgi:endoglucanase|uniref:Endoglucanase n=1 Tax=Paramaledivibacter caminithermalis (strain DSM 15212 / CIP 107654 / DViRD3) TaxID=1121301 RepID=A0A1M6MR52_PARC5|nr:M20/M25/M40 family metallo-hydrolase [Paramaledivibacter caminithermalis]SHJ85912.1 endoglucanase [Paramaledivibacter caminithermalis DSM 15212]